MISEALNMDCMEFMKTLPDGHFSLAIADPPYGAGVERGLWHSKKKYHGESNAQFVDIQFITPPPTTTSQNPKNWRNMGGEVREKKIIEWDITPSQEFFDELFRVSRNQIIWGGNYFQLPPCRCFLVWRKLTISESFTMAMAEYAWTSLNENAKVFDAAPQGKQKDQRFHPCLPAGTKVKFNNQWKNIEEVQIGDSNEFGNVCDVSTHYAEKLIEITVNKERVKATWNHPFLIMRGNAIYWINADQVKKGDKVLCVKKPIKQRERDIRDSEETANTIFGWNIASFGKNITAKFLKECKSIIKTLTRRTITLRTSSLSLRLNTSGCTKVADSSTAFGINRVRYVESTNHATKNIGISVVDGLTEESAKNASSRKYAKTVKCELRTVGSVKTIHERTKVYNLTIDGVPAFETKCGITHNTQKPVELYAWILRNFAKDGDTIFDPMMGSQSCRIAAYKMGFDFVGCEIDSVYFQKGEERFKSQCFGEHVTNGITEIQTSLFS